MYKRNIFLSIAALLAVGLTLTSCLDEENPYTVGLGVTPPTSFTATLNGASEKPTSTTSTATGAFVGKLNETTRVLSYTVTYTGLTPTMGHLHRIDTTRTDGTGGIDIPFPSLTSPIIASTTALTPLQIYRMKNNQYYANLHTTQYPAGEIRGDLRR
ncbi:CHRD domain-containing protein [Spirosoma validum]|uniref:CHRD domain-containing protein n=1 Tax=Spirosoma validum TaxID=2771355 RepID=A0A927B2Y3_9BACT|nr:CHRD domain-containing protein [Spirosoma validum]MBD2754438.1 CHRD domain-containing protein [Spirosoma validum]